MGGLTLYLVFMIPPLLLSLWAAWRVKATYAQASQVLASSGFTGADTARMILEANNISNVRVETTPGHLSDHYDPRAKVLRLSPDVYNGRSVAALGIAAHEVGHAIQDANGYAPLVIRNGIVPLANVGSNAGLILIMVGLLGASALGSLGGWILIGGIALFSLVVAFQLINLPVEFDASARAKRLLANTQLVAPGAQAQAMNRVLNAAALTYVAATVGTIMTLLYYIILASQQRE
ncbi:MAG: zinc metallopeptidase [Phycisphaerales bacterium]|jgi:Zn-dependent membrane protease YugP